jgi:uracil-DNA glycosylase
VSPSQKDVDAVARLLRQRADLGGGELYLDTLGREEALTLTVRGRAAGFPRTSPPSGAAEAGRPGAGGAGSKGAPAAGLVPPAAPFGAAPAGGEGTLPVLPTSYPELRDEALACTRCRLSESRTQVVFSDGVVDARLVVVGEAPGANEDATGLPFVGAAGQFLDLLLASVGLSRKESVYICNVLKCRPPGNRNPLPDEIGSCSPYLIRQLELVAPEALLAVGTFAAQALTGEQKPIGRLRGSVHSYQGIPLVVTYHPAALLRNPGWTRAFWDDLQLLRQVLDGG